MKQKMKIIRIHTLKEKEETMVLWEDVYDQVNWLGVNALKNPADAWLYQEIIYKIKPNFILETGSHKGGGALFLASMLDICGINDGVVYSIELEKYKMPSHPKISWVRGDSADPKIVEMILQKAKGKRGLVILDSDHSSGHVLKEIKAYWPIIAKDSYLIVEDTWFRPGSGGPYDAVEEFLKENDKFKIDKSKHRYITTNNPNGFLKRK